MEKSPSKNNSLMNTRRNSSDALRKESQASMVSARARNQGYQSQKAIPREHTRPLLHFQDRSATIEMQVVDVDQTPFLCAPQVAAPAADSFSSSSAITSISSR